MEAKEAEKDLLELLSREVPDLWTVYLFGSLAFGWGTPESDVDLAIVAARPVGPRNLGEIALKLASLVGRPVDLVDMRSAPLTLVARILEDGIILRNLQPLETAFFENSLMSRYCALNEERKEILKDIRLRGSVYAR